MDPGTASTRDLGDLGTPRIGELFASRYRIESLLGRGGFGMVFAARDTSLDRDVAIKVLVDADHGAAALARFLLEAKAVAALDSEHVVTVYEAAVAGRTPYIVMERLRGTDLHDLARERGRLPAGEAVELVLQAALGLAHAHGRGIVHRDLKPRNLFLAERTDGTRVVKVLDFGVAKAASSELTESGAVIGTTRYMAPEQLRSARGVDARTDVWALGVVLYELATGKPIFDADNSAELAVKILSDPHVPARARVPELPAALAATIDRCLEKEPANRPADLAAFARALGADAAVVARIERALGAAPGAPVPEPRARPSGFAIASLAFGACGVAFGIAMWLRTGDEPAPTLAPASAPIRPPPVVATAPAPPRDASVVADAVPDAAPPPDAAVARAASPPPPQPHAEFEAIYKVCTDGYHAPFFLNPRGQGFQAGCIQLGKLGCGKLASACASQPITDADKLACRDFLANLRRAHACP